LWCFPVRPLSDWHLSKAAVLLIFDLGPVSDVAKDKGAGRLL